MSSGEFAALGSVARFTGGGTPSKSNPAFWNGDIPWVSPKDMWVDEVVTAEDKITSEAVRSSATTLIPANALLCVVRSGILARKFPVAITRREVAINQDIKAIIPGKKVEARYLYYFLKASEPTILSGVTTGATVHRIGTDALKALELPLSSLEEQRRIVAVLDEAFAAIATATLNAEKNLAHARELYEQASSRLLTGGGSNWREQTLEDVCTISSKLVDPRLEEFIDLPHIGAGNIEARTGRLIDVLTAREEGLISGKFVFDPTMVLYSKIRPYLMKACRPDLAGLCSADIYPLAPKEGMLDRDFLFHLLLGRSFTAYAEAGSARAGMPKVNRDHLFAYRFKLPPLEDQREIAARIDALANAHRDLVWSLKRKLRELEKLKRSLLHRAFSGELTEREPLAA